MNDAIRTELTEIFRDLFGNDDLILSPEMTADDVAGWDSIKHISLMIAIEEGFGIEFTNREIDELRNVGDLERVVAMKAAGTNPAT